MKKIILSLSIAALMLTSPIADACTNVLVSKGASKNNSTMVSYSADSHSLYGALYYLPAAKHAPGTMRVIREWDTGKILGEIPEAPFTYSVVGNMNQHQLLIGESTFGGRSELRDKNGIMDYGSLMYVALQRCKTAREAVVMIGELMNQFGYFSSGESFSIADPNEVWYMELISKGTKLDDKGNNTNKGAVWVARRLPEGAVSAHANQARITQFPLNDAENCLYADDVISFARDMGYFTGEDKDFNFADAYAPLDFLALRACEARVWSVFKDLDPAMEKHVDYAMGKNPSNRMPLWIMPAEKVDVADVAEFMRDQYENSPLDMNNNESVVEGELPFKWTPLVYEYNGKKYFRERPISTKQTGWLFVGECRSYLPDPIGGVLWFGTDAAATSPLTPFYCGITRVPETYALGNGHLTQWAESSFWIQNRVANFAYGNYNAIYPDVKKAIAKHEDACLTEQPAIDMAAKMMYEKNPQLAIEFITDYSCNKATKLYEQWVELDKYLLVKFLDGNIKKEHSEGQFIDNGNNFNIPTAPQTPGQTDKWKKAIVEETGKKYLMLELKK